MYRVMWQYTATWLGYTVLCDWTRLPNWPDCLLGGWLVRLQIDANVGCKWIVIFGPSLRPYKSSMYESAHIMCKFCICCSSFLESSCKAPRSWTLILQGATLTVDQHPQTTLTINQTAFSSERDHSIDGSVISLLTHTCILWIFLFSYRVISDLSSMLLQPQASLVPWPSPALPLCPYTWPLNWALLSSKVK